MWIILRKCVLCTQVVVDRRANIVHQIITGCFRDLTGFARTMVWKCSLFHERTCRPQSLTMSCSHKDFNGEVIAEQGPLPSLTT